MFNTFPLNQTILFLIHSTLRFIFCWQWTIFIIINSLFSQCWYVPGIEVDGFQSWRFLYLSRIHNVRQNSQSINPLWPSETISNQWSTWWSTMVQLIPCWLLGTESLSELILIYCQLYHCTKFEWENWPFSLNKTRLKMSSMNDQQQHSIPYDIVCDEMYHGCKKMQ